MNFKKSLVSALVLSSVTAGCVSFDNPKKVANKNANYELYAKHALAYQEKTPNVYSFNIFYVPQLQNDDMKLPIWTSKKVGRSFGNKVNLDLLLNLSLSDKFINVEYREGVDKEHEITLNASNDLTVFDVIKAIKANTGYKVDVTDSSVIIHKYINKVFQIRSPGGIYEYSIGKRNEKSSDNKESDDFAQGEALTQAGDEYAVLKGEFNPLDDYLLGVESILGCKSNEELQRIISAESAPVLNKDEVGSYFESPKPTVQNRCEAGASAKIIESDNSIFVKALPSQLVEVEKFISDKTERELRQVRINLTLVAVENNNDTAFNFDADIIDKTLAGVDKIALETVSKSASSLIGGLGDRGRASLSHVNGTSLILENLARRGSILDKTFMSAITSNNRIGKFTDATKVSLITDRPVNQTTNVGSLSGVEQKVVNSGRVFYMLPNIGDSDVVLSISTSLSSLKDIVQKGGEGLEVESPEISDREINTTVKLEPNKPKIIGGFSIDESQSLFSQTGLTGIGRSSRDREVLVVMVAEAVME